MNSASQTEIIQELLQRIDPDSLNNFGLLSEGLAAQACGLELATWFESVVRAEQTRRGTVDDFVFQTLHVETWDTATLLSNLAFALSVQRASYQMMTVQATDFIWATTNLIVEELAQRLLGVAQ